MKYYRVACINDQSFMWQWKPIFFTSLEGVNRFLLIYRLLSPHPLRVFSSSSLASLNELLMCENQGTTCSVTAEQFLHGQEQPSGEMLQAALERTPDTQSREGLPSPAALAVEGRNPVDTLQDDPCTLCSHRRLEGELGAGGDHDGVYTFSLPTALSQLLAWARLLGKVTRGELEP